MSQFSSFVFFFIDASAGLIGNRTGTNSRRPRLHLFFRGKYYLRRHRRHREYIFGISLRCGFINQTEVYNFSAVYQSIFNAHSRTGTHTNNHGDDCDVRLPQREFSSRNYARKQQITITTVNER